MSLTTTRITAKVAVLSTLTLVLNGFFSLLVQADPDFHADLSIMDPQSVQSVMPTESRLGRVTPRIVGGDVATFGEQRWISSLQFRQRHICGAALIAPSWVITAAHCVAGVSLSTTPLTVWVGGHDLRVSSQGEQREIAQIVVHPSFNPNNMGHDIALVRLQSPVTNITPVRLASAQVMAAQAAPGQPVTVSGWGALSEGRGSPAKLHDVTVPVVPNATCNAPAAYAGQVASTMMCAGLSNGGQDACQGDSGGPLWLNINGVDVHVGIVSWGTGCARPNKYGVYTRSAAYRNWISRVTNLNLENPIPPGIDAQAPDHCASPPGQTPTSEEEVENFSYTFTEMPQREALYFEVTVPSGVRALVIQTSGGRGDMDIYLSKEQRPSVNSFDYVSRNPASAERIRVDNPAAGTWYVMAYAYSRASGASFNLRMLK